MNTEFSVGTITESELLDALAGASLGTDGPEGAITVQEIRDNTGLSRPRVLRGLKILQGQGRIQACRVSRVDLAGRNTSVPAYVLLPPVKTTKAKKQSR